MDSKILSSQTSFGCGVSGRILGKRLVARSSRPAASRAAVRVVAFKELTGKGLAKKVSDPDALYEDVIEKAEFYCGGNREEATSSFAYDGVAWSVREQLLERMRKTHAMWREKDPKSVYYLSAEFLMGRSLTNAIQNMGIDGPYGEILNKLGYDLETVVEEERDAALGNGGLGRLAACFLDAMATLELPGWGYGIRYKYGMFKQVIDADGKQMEVPDIWLTKSNPWEVKRPSITFPVSFGEEKVKAVAYDVPIPGYNTQNTATLRLWDCEPVEEFDLDSFNEGEFYEAYDAKERAEAITSVLYPNDSTDEGKFLRLKQQYFFVSASLQDVVAKFKSKHGTNWDLLPEKACFQLNDTHPTIGVAEMMRILMDQEGLGWTKSWEVTQQLFAFTNHTVMPEALEKWPAKVLRKLLPRVTAIIDEIDERWTKQLEERFADLEPEEQKEKVTSLSIIQPNPWKKEELLVNMAHLAIVGAKAVNGVAAIHSEIIKDTIFKGFYEIWPEKFQNKTNGVTPRRWLAFCNPELATLITDTLGTDAWKTDMSLLSGLAEKATDPAFQKQWRGVKQVKKAKLAAKIKEITGEEVDTNAMFDIQIKRIHEYKRQYMNILSVIWRYLNIKKMTPEERKSVVPRVVIIGGKAASAYDMAKRIIGLINAVGNKINNDPDVGDLLKVYFLPDYNVSLAETLIPAADLSQHISTAGTEASGTSNMKFQMNGSLIIGTMDGANIEIAEEVSKVIGEDAKVGDGLFIFGVDADEVDTLREERKDFKTDPRWDTIMELIEEGEFGDEKYFKSLVDSVNDMEVGNDWFLLANDFATYLDAQEEVDRVWSDQDEWTRRSILYTVSSGKFSSDRTIAEYAKDIWGVEGLSV
ncbi:hypothetical protein BSKO_05023 [Bryopsis sp. KO-2023]|nr:hypothetical protein BSKO_05023 [Bryopsis sp. KO-2023]